MSVNMEQWLPVCSLCTKPKGHQMKLAVNVLKANKAEWFLTYCLSKLWTFFLQDMDAKILCVSCFQGKKKQLTRPGKKNQLRSTKH